MFSAGVLLQLVWIIKVGGMPETTVMHAWHCVTMFLTIGTSRNIAFG
jgi:hypothetical protein